MSYKFKDHYVESNTSTNIYTAIFTTANARLRFYEKFHELGDAIIYRDTRPIAYDNWKKYYQDRWYASRMDWWAQKRWLFIKISTSTGPTSY